MMRIALLAAALAQAATPQAGTATAPRAPRGGSTLVPPPFVPEVGADPARPGQSTGALPPPYLPGARQFLVQPGQTWKHVLEDIEPGDEIVFPPGFHVPQEVDGLTGTRERPIILRSRDRVPAAVVCGEFGWKFRRPRHVIVENVMFLNPTGAAIAVEGAPGEATPWNAEVTIRNCTIAGNRPAEGQDAVRLERVSDVRLDKLRIDGWVDAAVEIESSRRVLVRAAMLVPPDTALPACGIKVLGTSGEVSVTGCAFNKRLRTGVSVGTPRSAADAAPKPVERMRIDRCIFEEPGTAVSVANARDLVISRATVVNPTDAIYSVDGGAVTVEQVLIEKCLGYWTPGVLARFSPHPEGTSPTGISLADNLWYSRELPEAWEVLGAPFGVQLKAQVTGIDPGIDATTLKPRNGEAIRYGAFSMAATAGGRKPENPADPAEPLPMQPGASPTPAVPAPAAPPAAPPGP